MDTKAVQLLINTIYKGNLAGFAGDLNKLNNNLQRVGRGVYLLNNSFKLFKSAATDVSKVVKTLYTQFNLIGKTFNQLQMSSLGAANSILKIKGAYDQLRMSGQKLNVSQIQIAAGITKFQKQGLVQNAFMQSKKNVDAYVKTLNQLGVTMDQTAAADSLASMFQGMDQSRISQIPVILKKISEAKSSEELESIKNEMLGISDDSGSVLEVFNNLQAGMNPSTLSGWQKLQQVMNQIKTQVADKLLEVFEKNQNAIKNLFDALLAKIPSLAASFEPFANALLNTLPVVVTGFQNLLNLATPVLNWFNSLSSSTQTAIALMTVFSGLVAKVGIGLASFGWGAAKFGLGKLGLLSIAKGTADVAGATGLTALGGTVLGTGAALALPAIAAGAAIYGLHDLYNTNQQGYASEAQTAGLSNQLGNISSRNLSSSNVMDQLKGQRQALRVRIGRSESGPELQELQRQYNEITQKIGDYKDTEKETRIIVADVTKEQHKQSETIKLNAVDYSVLAKEIEGINKNITISASRTQALNSALDFLGPSAKLAGKSLSEVATQKNINSYREATLNIEKLKDALNKAIAAGNENQAKEYADQISTAFGQMETFAKGATHSLENLNAELELQKGMQQEALRINQALYGTPALAVQAQQEIVATIEQQINAKQKELNVTHKLMEAANQSEDEQRARRMQAKQLEKEILSLKAEQVESVKALRDGYLDAVKEEALGFGRFSKIIISQKKGIMLALDTGMAKKNFLLGQAGVVGGNKAYRFSGGSVFNPLGGVNANLQKVGGGNVDLNNTVNATTNSFDSLNKTIDEVRDKFRASAGLQALTPGSAASTTTTGAIINAATSSSGTAFTGASSKNSAENVAAALRYAADGIAAMGKDFDNFAGDGHQLGSPIAHGGWAKAHGTRRR